MRAGTPPRNASFDRIAQEALAAKQAPGFSIGIFREGRFVYAKGFGMADVASKKTATPETRFAIGSMTKQFTAASVLLLAERGKLSLDDRLGKYLPDFPNAQKITLRDLLHQTSGLHNYPNTEEHRWPLFGTIAPTKLLAIMKTDKPDFEPGTKWEYSNTNYAVLAYIVATASGMPYGDFLQRDIFKPLGMTSSGYGYSAQQRPGIATPYMSSVAVKPGERLSLDLYYGAGGLVSTARDMLKWDAALLRGKLLGAASMHEFWTAGTLSDGKPVEYAMGFVPATIDGHREVWHNGLTPYASGYCYNAIFPDDKLAVVVLSNDAGFAQTPERIVREVFEAYYPQAKPAKTTFSPAAGEDPNVTARAKEWLQRMQTGDVDRSQLDAQANSLLTADVVAQAKREFSPVGTPTSFQYAGKKQAQGYTTYEYRVVFKDSVAKWLFVFGPDGKISGLRLTPWQ